MQVAGTVIGTPGSPNSITFNGAVNAPGASGPGVDLGASFEIVDGLTFGGSFSWNDLQFKEDVRKALPSCSKRIRGSLSRRSTPPAPTSNTCALWSRVTKVSSRVGGIYARKC